MSSMYVSVTLLLLSYIWDISPVWVSQVIFLPGMNLLLPAEGRDSHWSSRRPLLLLWLWAIVKSHKRLYITDTYMFSHPLRLRIESRVLCLVISETEIIGSCTELTPLPFKKTVNTLIATLSFLPQISLIWYVIKFSPIEKHLIIHADNDQTRRELWREISLNAGDKCFMSRK